jgi:hypothetical protein
MAVDRSSPGAPAGNAQAHLVASVAALLSHLQECEICREVGVAYCSVLNHLAHTVRNDRRHLVTG